MPSEFRADRDHNTAPDFDDPMEAKIAYQKRLKRQWAEFKCPSDLMKIMLREDANRWWTDPHKSPQRNPKDAA